MNKLNLLERTILTYMNHFEIDNMPNIEDIAADLSLNLKTTTSIFRSLIFNNVYEPAAKLDFDDMLNFFYKVGVDVVIQNHSI